MEEKQKQQILKNLFAADENTAVDAIEKIKTFGDQDMLNAVLNLLESNPKKNVHLKINELLSSLKDEKSVETIIAAVKNPKLAEHFQILASSIWMSGLNYAEYLDIFTEKFISEKLISAFEAFTVIENTDSNYISEKMLEKMIKLLDKAKNEISDDKKNLYFDLYNVIETKKEEKLHNEKFSESSQNHKHKK